MFIANVFLMIRNMRNERNERNVRYVRNERKPTCLSFDSAGLSNCRLHVRTTNVTANKRTKDEWCLLVNLVR